MLPIVSLSAQKSLVLYLSFDGNLNDLSKTRLKGKLEGKADFIDGKAGNALLFDGKSSVEIPHDKALSLTQAHAISFWLKWGGGGASWCPFVAKRSADGANYQCWVGSDKYLITIMGQRLCWQRPLCLWVRIGFLNYDV